jgi:PAS domain S-box-containing protein
MKLLLLEDHVADAELTKRALTKRWPDCDIAHVTLVGEANNLLAERTDFDIALLDMQLPDGNGLDVLMGIRQRNLDMAVAVLTGSGDEEVAVAALKAGADNYTVKQPGYTSGVSATVERALENRRLYREQVSSVIHVLYIEHNAADVDFTRRHLARYAPFITLTDVPSGEWALKLLPPKGARPETWDYQLVLMDYRLPGMNALELIKEIRQERALDIPILIVTGQGNENVAVQALKVGANDYLVKREHYLSRLPTLITATYQHCELKRKQEALAKSESQYRLLAENSGDVIFTLDFDLRYTYVSPAVFQVQGYTPEEVLSKLIAGFLTAPSYQQLQEAIHSIQSEAIDTPLSFKPRVLELELFKKDGSTSWVEVKITLSTDAVMRPVGVLGVSRDITKRKMVEDRLRKLSQAVIQSPDSIIITDRDGCIEYVNPTFLHLTGYSEAEVIGENPRLVKSGNHPVEFYKTLWDTILTGKTWYGEFQNKKKNGELYWEIASISPLFNEEGVITHFIAVNKDITERKNMIEELIMAKEKAEESDRLKSAFLANMSHEIRTPMNGILGFTTLLQDPSLSAEDRSDYLEIVRKSGQRLLNTVNDIIEISKIEAGLEVVHLTPVDVNECLTEVNDFFSLEAKQKGLALHLDRVLPPEYPIILTDKTKMDSILVNLVKNAIKYTDYGTVRFGCSLQKEGLLFHVADTGIGIPADRLEAIFNRFEQADIADKRAFQGSGLGLTLVKSYVEMLGGTISVTSEVGVGTEFLVTIPVERPLEETQEVEKTASSATQPLDTSLKVLIVEDDEPSSIFLRMILSKYNVQSIHAANGFEAVKMVNEQPDISLVLMDVKMPVMNGIEATRQIRQFNTSIPIIAQTAHVYQSEKETMLDVGFTDYISKPINQGLLMEMVRRYTKNRA